jgi:hypothetical protein
MNKQQKQKRKYGIVPKLLAALGVFTILMTTLFVLIFELSAILLAIYAAALAAIVGPVFTAGPSSFVEIVTGMIELVMEGVAMIFDFIATLFSGF